MKRIILSALALSALAGCSSTPLEKASLEYKVFPKASNYQYEFDLAISKPTDARSTKFVLDRDGYFDQDIRKSLANIIFEEIRASNSFNTIAVLDNSVSFNPTSSQIQEVRRTTGKDAVLLTQVNKFNANIRKLSDLDASNLVNLTVFTNISYKLILAESETIIFLTTKDTTSSKVVPLNDDFYITVNELAQKNIKANIIDAKNDFLAATKSTLNARADFEAEKQEITIAQEYKAPVENPIAQEVAKEVEKSLDENAQEQPVEDTTVIADDVQTAQAPTEEAANQTALEETTAETVEPTTQVEEAQATESVQETTVEQVETTPVEETVETTQNVTETTVEEATQTAPTEVEEVTTTQAVQAN